MSDTISFTQGCKRFFGLKPGETIAEFGAEIRALTEKDRREMAPGLGKELGVEIDPATLVPPVKQS